MTKQALKIAYATIENRTCNEYSIIVDRIIESELKLGKVAKAEKIALERLNKLNPNWQNVDSKVDPSHLSILSTIKSIKPSNSFYRSVRKTNGSYGVCGFTTYEEDVSTLYWQAEKLFEEYGKNYCLKFLQASTVLINENNERALKIWENIYSLLIESLGPHYSYNEIKNQYESAKIQKYDLNEWHFVSWEYNYQFHKSQYFIEIGGMKLFFQTTACPDSQNQFKRCQPTNCEILKKESKLYKKIKEYAS